MNDKKRLQELKVGGHELVEVVAMAMSFGRHLAIHPREDPTHVLKLWEERPREEKAVWREDALAAVRELQRGKKG
jgi:hypothetical protein